MQEEDKSMLVDKINQLRGVGNKNTAQNQFAEIPPTNSLLEQQINKAKNIDASEYINENTQYDEFGMPIFDTDIKSDL